MNHTQRALSTLTLMLVTFCWTACSQAQPKPDPKPRSSVESKFSIENVKGDVYRITAGHYHSVFLVTEAGIMLTDPISTEASKWLSAEIARRFDQPVRYVVYSHSHTDHTYGGEVWDRPGVVFVSHDLARQALERTKARTHLPELTFSESLVIRLADHVVRLTYHGPNNGRGSVSMHFETERLIYVVDWIVLGRLPYKDLRGYDIEGVIDSTRQVLERDFDTFVGGHADIGKKSDIRRYLAYVESLFEQVLAGMRAGRTLEQIQAEVDLAEFSDLKMYDEWKALNVKGVYESLRDDSYLLMRPDVPDVD